MRSCVLYMIMHDFMKKKDNDLTQCWVGMDWPTTPHIGDDLSDHGWSNSFSWTDRRIQPAKQEYLDVPQAVVSGGQCSGWRSKVMVPLTMIGPKPYGILKCLLSLTLPKDKSMDDQVDASKAHYDPKPSVITERFRFYQRSQKENKPITEFSADLHQIMICCEFGDFLPQALWDRFVRGIRSNSEKKLLTKNAKLTAKQAHFQEATCNKCDKRGHIAVVCRSKVKVQNPQSKNQSQRCVTEQTKWVETRCYGCPGQWHGCLYDR